MNTKDDDASRNVILAQVLASPHNNLNYTSRPNHEQIPQLCLRNTRATAIMAHINKIAVTSPSRKHPSELETSIASAIYDLETNIADMKSALRPLQFVSAREV